MNYIESKINCCYSIGINLMSESDLALITTDDYWSYLYAREVLTGRFELGEAAIAKDTVYSYRYAIWVLKGRFELGEEAIAADGWYSLCYAHEVLNGRFELGEAAIALGHYKSDYIKFLNIYGIDFELH